LIADAYRSLTGDTISPQAKVAGGALYGGPIGLVLSVADAAIAAVSGKEVGQHVIAGLFGDGEPATRTASATTATQMAAAQTPATPETTASVAANPAPAAATAPALAASRTPPPPMPQLSPDAFNALIGSFADPKAAKAANPEMAKKVAEAQTAAQGARAAVSQPPATPDLLGAMQTNLDRLDALKAANPDLPVAAFASGDTGGY
jgi:hypothetical protein